jgi:hypothetical protein
MPSAVEGAQTRPAADRPDPTRFVVQQSRLNPWLAAEGQRTGAGGVGPEHSTANGTREFDALVIAKHLTGIYFSRYRSQVAPPDLAKPHQATSRTSFGRPHPTGIPKNQKSMAATLLTSSGLVPGLVGSGAPRWRRMHGRIFHIWRELR